MAIAPSILTAVYIMLKRNADYAGTRQNPVPAARSASFARTARAFAVSPRLS